jgi:hypothetical protein
LQEKKKPMKDKEEEEKREKRERKKAFLISRPNKALSFCKDEMTSDIFFLFVLSSPFPAFLSLSRRTDFCMWSNHSIVSLPSLLAVPGHIPTAATTVVTPKALPCSARRYWPQPLKRSGSSPCSSPNLKLLFPSVFPPSEPRLKLASFFSLFFFLLLFSTQLRLSQLYLFESFLNDSPRLFFFCA